MRVAVCISGFMRLCEETRESFLSRLVAPFDADIFVSTWAPGGDEAAWLENIQAIYRPAVVEIEEWPKTLEAWGDLSPYEARKRSDVKVPNVLGMFYKIHRANRLKRMAEAEKGFRYDAVVRMRTDVMLYETPELGKITPGYAYIGNSFGYGGLPDLFAYGDSATMDLYSDVFHRIPAYVAEGCLVHPEMLLEWHVRRTMPQGVIIGQVPYRLVRPADQPNPTVWMIR